jgi:hypothetical protein
MDGRSIVETLELPVRQRQILNLVRRHQECSFSQLVTELNADEQNLRQEIDILVAQNFLQQSTIAGEIYYRIKLSQKEGSALDKIGQVLTPGKPLAIITNPSGEQSVQAGGEPFKLRVTVTNQGNESALIDVYIDPTCQLIQQACYLAPSSQRLALTPGQSSEVEFEIPIQMETSPGLYNYLLVIDAPNHYPEDTPLQFYNQLRITPFIQEASTDSDPSFTIKPSTNSEQRILVAPGEFLELTIEVLNRAKRVDRFRLTCPDLDRNWYKVIYPEGLAVPGIVVTTEALELNPGQTGEISLQLLIPANALARIYTPTIRLFSDNHPDLALLDIFYFEVTPIYLLDIQFLTLVSKVKNTPGKFQLQLINYGNIARNLTIRAISADEEELCRYTLEPPQVHLLPGTKQSIDLKVYPPKSGWRRPFYGRLFNFVIDIEDLDQLPLVNNRLQGALMWAGRPWWQFLLFLLTGLGIIGAIALLIWWFFFRPKPIPEIIAFSPESPTYKAFNNDLIRLQWEISQPHNIDSIKIVGLSPDGRIISEPRTFDFRQGMPRDLSQFCQKERILTCENIPTDARQAGDYIFELTLLTQTGETITSKTMKTNTVRIEPIPLPTIVNFQSSQSLYQEVRFTENSQANPSIRRGILINWQIDNINQITSLSLVGRDSEGIINTPQQNFSFNTGLPEALAPFCQIQVQTLVCKAVPTYATRPGIYVFELTVTPQQGENVISQKTDPVKIQALPATITAFNIQGNQAQPKYQIPINTEQSTFLVLEWEVKGSQNTKVELLPAPGTVPLTGKVAYPISQTPKTETITLQVTNPDGEQITRSVTIETVTLPATVTALEDEDSSVQIPPSLANTIPTLPPLESGSPVLLPPDTMMPSTAGETQDPSLSNSLDSLKPNSEIVLPPIFPEGNSLPPAELPPQSN